ncbi:MAG: hypothetical protein EU531_06795 [Promethearchaeota archaeon]|nr:MAG: hypothetical protein EU531_06795 [Candidatus Lokiarchaeota archaeon]
MLFVFSYSFETIFILQKMMGSPPERIHRNQVIKRGLFFILLGFLYNWIIYLVSGFTSGGWGWNIILFLGFAQIIIYFSFKLIRWARVVIGLSILLFTPILRELLFFSKSNNIFLNLIYFFIVSPDPSLCLLPYASLCFFASIFSELIYQAKVLENKKAIKISIKSTLRHGFAFLLAGIALSLTDFNPLITSDFYNPLKYPFIDAHPILQNQEFQYIPYMPEILLSGTVAYILFTVGLLIVTIGLLFFISEVRVRESKIFNGLRFYGRYSITIIFIQYIFLPLFVYQLNILLFVLISILYIIILGYLIYLWNKYANDKGTIEWIIEKSTIRRINRL